MGMATQIGGIPNIERSRGERKPTARPHGQPHKKPHSSAGMCMGQSIEPILGTWPVKNGSTIARARQSAE